MLRSWKRDPLARRHDAPVDELDLGEVRLADEVRDETRSRPAVDLLSRPDLLYASFVHDRDAVGHRHRLALVMGDEHEGRPDLPLDLGELDLEPLAQLEIERSKRLIEQQDGGPVDQRASNGDTLLLAARELAGVA